MAEFLPPFPFLLSPPLKSARVNDATVAAYTTSAALSLQIQPG